MSLSRFRVFNVLATARAKFLEPQAILDVLLVLARLVITFLAIAARESQNRLILVCHNSPSFKTNLLKPIS